MKFRIYQLVLRKHLVHHVGNYDTEMETIQPNAVLPNRIERKKLNFKKFKKKKKKR